jgi:hypothetical protein
MSMSTVKRVVTAWLVLVTMSGASACASAATRQTAQLAAPSRDAEEKRGIVIHAYEKGLVGVSAANPDVKLSVGHDSALVGESVLFMDYPGPTSDPAARDVHLDTEHRDWTAGKAIVFRVKPTNAMRLSVSFVDRNHVVYTAWTNTQGGVWQSVRISFDGIRPNPYFQPPDAKTGGPIDVSEVNSIAFAPQDRASGSLAISQIVVVR